MIASEIPEDSVLGASSLWWLLTLFGLATLAVGVFFVIAPHETLRVFTLIAGIFILVDGILAVGNSIFGQPESRGLLALVGVISAVAGLVLIKEPFGALIVLTAIFGIWFIIVGGVRFVAALTMRGNRAASIVVALLEVVAGIVILSWPEISLATLAVIVGIVMILRGLLFTWAGLQLRALR
jgi:uncharacterized membrane protein HdeD (DUF308 family)